MSDTITRQCQECAREFEIEGPLRGRPPSRCPNCKKDAQEREQSNGKARKPARRVAARSIPENVALVDYEGVMGQLRTEIEQLEEAIAARRAALAALEVLAR